MDLASNEPIVIGTARGASDAHGAFLHGRPWHKHLIPLNSFALTTSVQGGDYQYLHFTDKDKHAWGQLIL